MRALAIDGALARHALVVTEVITASALTLLTTAPAWLFAVVGAWQPAHPSLWIGASTTLVVGPALSALLTVVRGAVHERTRSERALSTWGRAYLAGARQWRSWLVVAALVLLAAYQVALGDGGVTALPAIALGGVAAAVLVAVASGVAATSGSTITTTTTTTAARAGVGSSPSSVAGSAAIAVPALRAAARSPLAVLVWVVLGVAGVLVGLVPIAGPALAFLAPAGWAVAVVVVNATFGFEQRLADVR